MSISTLVFRPGLWNLYPFSLRNSWGWLVASLLRLELQQKRFLKIHFELAHFSFFLIHSELIRWINTFIHTRSFLENHTISVYPCSDQNGAKTLRGEGGYTYIYGLYKGAPPPPSKAKRLSIKSGFSFNVIIKSILRKQATFRNLTTGFPAKWRLRNERRNSILMMFHYPDLGSDTSSVRGFSSALVSQMSLRGETSCGISKCRQLPETHLLTVKMEHTMNTKNTAIIARFILKWSVNLN